MNKFLYYFLIFGQSFLFAEEINYSSPLVDSSVGLIKSLVKSIIIVVVMLVLFAYWKKKILPSMVTKSVPGQKMRIIEKLFLDYTTTLYLVEIGNQYQIYGVSNKNIELMNSFKKSEIKFAENKSKAKEESFKKQLAFFSKLNQIKGKRK